jgi:glycosyltransferase involved in cell wall biosynthesis
MKGSFFMESNLIIYVCTYNEENNIEDCIACIKNSGFDNIFVVDASDNDLTKKRAVRSGATVITSSRGLPIQRQVAIDHCNKTYLMFVDADDRLDNKCIIELMGDMKKNNYDAVQAKLRVVNPKTYWQKGMDAVWEHCIAVVPGPSIMVGRPALFKTEILKKAGMDTEFGDNGNEDAALSIRIERISNRLGIGNGKCFRHSPPTFLENFKAWKKYGRGDAGLIRGYPEKIKNVIMHLCYTYPVERSYLLIKNGKAGYIGYPVCMGVFRLLFMFVYLIKAIIIARNKVRLGH